MDLNEFANCRLKLFDTAKGAAADSFVGEFGEPSLHQIQPRAIGRREVDVRGRLSSQFRMRAVLCVP